MRGRILCAVLLVLLAGCSPGPPSLFLLLTVDTLRADRLGAYGSELGLSPHLDTLARESIVFEHAYAPAPFTLPSISALLTGLFPEDNAILVNESLLAASVPTLATQLSERGWNTAAVVSNFVLRSGSGLAAGFDVFDDAFPQNEAVRGWPERIAADTADAALAHLETCAGAPGERCFLWVHFQDPHGPYTPPEGRRARHLAAERSAPGGRTLLPLNPKETGEGGIPAYQALDGEREVAFYRAGYHAEIEYLDEEIGRLLEAVRDRRAPTLVVFAADHGEALGEGDVWFSHGERLDEGMVRVPLFLRVPGERAARRTDVASLVDVAPTVLRLLEEIPAPPESRGRDLLADGAESGASVHYMSTLGTSPVLRFGIIGDGYKFVISGREGGKLWDGRLTALGRDEVDLAAAAPQIARSLRRRLAAMRRTLRPWSDEVRQSLSEADRERLRALGYVEAR